MNIPHFKRVSVIGLGYIGLPTAAMFASRKVEVIGVDVNPLTVDTINRGEIHIIEPGLDSIVSKAVKQGYLRASTQPQPADAFLIAVPTPFKSMNHDPDLSFIEAASRSIAPVLRDGNLVILESTSPLGATEQMANWLAELRPDLTFPQTHGEESSIRVAHCPERVLPGRVLEELVANDRVIGGMTALCSSYASHLYNIFVEGSCIISSGPRVAEMCKLTENSFRDVNIAFANELSLICDELGVDVWELIRLANHHPRVEILQPGPGVGGHCIAVDPWFIVSSAPDISHLIRTAREVNDQKPEWVIRKVHEAIKAHLEENPHKISSDVTLALYGLTFKPDIDDLRESPALNIASEILRSHDGTVYIVEPNIANLPDSLAGGHLESMKNAQNADVHVLLVHHHEFFGSKPSSGRIVDTRGIW